MKLMFAHALLAAGVFVFAALIEGPGASGMVCRPMAERALAALGVLRTGPRLDHGGPPAPPHQRPSRALRHRLWTLATHVADVTPEEMQRRFEEMTKQGG